MRNLLLKILLLLFCSLPALSQTGSVTKTTSWDFSFTSGLVIGGPSPEMIDILHDSGHNWDLQTKSYLPAEFELNWTINHHLRVGVNLSILNQDLERVELSVYKWSLCNFKTIAINPLISYNFGNVIFLDAGPSLNRISYFHGTGTSLTDNEDYIELGFTVKSILEFPKTSRIHFRLEMQYCYGGTINPDFNIENANRQYTFTTLHADNLRICYFYSGIGFGIRLFKK
jgi:hypothetical protein